jgi:hypothetical protein
MRILRVGRAGAASFLGVVLALVLSQLSSGATAYGYATRLPAPSGSPKTAEVQISAISCTSVGNCTAAGSYLPNRNSTTQTSVIDEEVSGRWTRAQLLQAPANATTGSFLSAISCPSPGDCVALGFYFAGEVGESYVASESAGTWSRGVELPLPGNAAGGSFSLALAWSLSCTLITSCVVVGTYAATSGNPAFIDTESGGVWSAAEAVMPSDATTPEDARLEAVSCTSAGNCVAVGSYSNAHGDQLVAATETSGAWGRAVRVAFPANSLRVEGIQPSFDAVSCPSTTTCVAGGAYNTSHGTEGLFDSETGGTWGTPTEARLPHTALTKGQSAGVQTLACSSASQCVAGGFYTSSVNTQDPTALTFSKAGGTWAPGQLVGLPAGATKPSSQESSINGVACTALGKCEAVGVYLDTYFQGSFATTPATVPSAPRIVRVTPLTGGFMVAIKAPSSNGGLQITTYQYSLNAGGTWVNRQSGSNATTIVISKLATDHQYRLSVRAVTSAGSGSGSNVVTSKTK